MNPDPSPPPTSWWEWLLLLCDTEGWRRAGPRGWMLFFSGVMLGGSGGMYLFLQFTYAVGIAAVDIMSIGMYTAILLALPILAGVAALMVALAPIYWRLPWWLAAPLTAGLCKLSLWLWAEDWRLVEGLAYLPEAL